MKKLLALLLCLAMVLTLAACGEETNPTEAPTDAPTTEPTTVPTEPPITVEDVYAKTADAMKNSQPTAMHMDLAFDATYKTGENAEPETVAYSMLMDIRVSEDPFCVYNITSLGINMADFNMDLTINVYIVEEDGQVVTYTSFMDTWNRTEMDMTVEEYRSSGASENIDTSDIWTGGEMPAGMTLDPFTQDLNGTEVYILRASIPADSISDAVAEMGVDLEQDVDELTMPVVYYVDAQSYTVLRMEADMQILEDALAATLAESLLGSEDQAGELTLNVPNIVYDLSYGAVEIPALPQEAIEQTQEPTEAPTETPTEAPTETNPTVLLPSADKASNLGGGVFVLPCGSEAVTITCPDGWEGEIYDDINVWIYNEDQSRYGDIYYFTDYTEDDFLDQIQADIDTLKDMDIFNSSGDGPAFEGYTTKQILGDGENYCYAWTPMGDGYLLAILADFTEEPDLESLLTQVLESLAPYTGDFAPTGTFTLLCGSEAVNITCPEGWDGMVYDDNNIWTYNDDDSVYGDFFYLADWTEDDILTYWVQPDIDTMKSEDTFESTGDGPAIEGYTAKVVIGTETSYYYAWTPIGEGYLLVQVYDWYNDYEAAELLPQVLNFLSVG